MDRTTKLTAKVMRTLLERFGEPLLEGDGQGVPTGDRKEDMGNRGFGARFDEDVTPGDVNEPRCDECGGMMGMDEVTCTQCGKMGDMDEAQQARHPGHAASCTCPDCSRPETDELA